MQMGSRPKALESRAKAVLAAAALVVTLLQGCRSTDMGTPLLISDVFPATERGASGFAVEYLDRPGGTMQTAPLDQVRLSEDMLSVAGAGYRVDFSLQSRGSYLVLRIRDVAEPVPGTLMKLAFRVPAESPFVLIRLDYMSVPSRDGKAMSWPWLWARNTPNPLGAFAIQAPRDDAEFDDNLLRMWVHDGLPHPPGRWTMRRARAWLAEWQRRFSDQSCLVVGAKNRAELDRMTAWAEKIGMKQVYLHADSWRGEYWPREHSYMHVNREVFPRGEEDLNNYTAELRRKGMSVAIHGTCISIARNDPDYARNGIDPRLSRWVRGTLAQDAEADDTVLHFRPAPGARYPRQVRHEWVGPNTMRSWMNLRLFLLGEELVEVRSVENTDADVWVLEGCRRGAWGKSAAAHRAGTVFEGLTRPYGQVFVPDADSTLLPETVRRWAEFCARNNVDHLECDALEDHRDRPWGADKFSWLLASHLTLPSTSNTSGGCPLPFNIEYWFRSSRPVLANHARAGVAGGASLPLYLHSDIRPATGPYEILFKPAEMVGRGGNSFNVSYPWPMFGVTPDILDNHGMVPVVEKLLGNWRAVLKSISPECREAIAGEYGRFRSPLGAARNQHGTDVLFPPELVQGETRIVPLRLVGRAAGELNWGFGQEFGPIVPRQYVRTGDSLQLTNAWSAKEPEFVIRVMGELAESADAPDARQAQASGSNAILDAYAAGTTTDFTVHPLHSAHHIWPAAAVANGEAKPGQVLLRRTFTVSDPAAVKRARLFLHVDDEAVAHLNGKKVFAGGRYDQVLFADIANLRSGENELTVKATNGSGPGCFTAALHLEQAGASRVLASDSSWQGKVGEGDWGAVTELAAFGASVWPRARPQLAVVRHDLMPHSSTIEPAAGHELVVDGKTLHVACRNDSNDTATHAEDRPAWATSLDMSAARGIGCTVTGDGSGAVLVITIEGRGHRDYVVPIDFNGTREICIPSGEVAWGDPHWSWRGHGRFDYGRIRKVRIGFGTVPPETHAKVTVRNIRPLREVACELQDFTIKLGPGRELVVPGAVPSGHYLWYLGGDSIGLYDLNWNKVRDCEVRKQGFVVPMGPLTVQFAGAAEGQRAWLEAQFFTRGDPIAPGSSTVPRAAESGPRL